MQMRFLCLVPTAIAAVACNTIESEDIDTDAIEANINLRSAEGATNTSVSATLKAGLTTFIDLDGDDTLTASVDGGAPVTLDEFQIAGTASYSVDIQTQQPGTSVVVSLNRTQFASAPNNVVTLTEQLALTGPAAAATFSRANDRIDVAWTSEASDDPVHVSWSGTCVVDGSRDVLAGESAVSIEGGTIQQKPDPEEGEPTPDNCDVTLAVNRTRTGTLDPAWNGGSIAHTYSDSVQFSSQP